MNCILTWKDRELENCIESYMDTTMTEIVTR